MRKGFYIINIMFILTIFVTLFAISFPAERVHAEAEFRTSEIPLYPRSKRVEIGKDIRINGKAVQISCFKTKDSPAQVIEYYASLWEKSNQPVVKQIDTKIGSMVSVIKNRYMFTVTVQWDEQQRCSLVFPSKMKLNQKLNKKKLDDLPIYPGTQGSFHLESQDYGANADTLICRNSGSLISNIGFYQARMLGAGWKYQEIPMFDRLRTGRILFFCKDKKECFILLQKSDDDSGTHAMITLIERT